MTQPNLWLPLGATVVDLGGITQAAGLSEEAAWWAQLLVNEYEAHAPHNDMLRRYYDGIVAVSDYGVGAEIKNDQTCHWPAKAVDALADRITFDGFSMPDELDDGMTDAIESIERENNLANNYNKHLTPKLLYGCMAATVTRNVEGNAVVRFHSAETFTAIPSPDGKDGVVAAGMAIARIEHTQWSGMQPVPTVVNLHLPNNVVELRQVGQNEWVAEDGYTPEEEPSLYVFTHDGTGTLNAFGRTRINRYVRTLTDDAIRCMWHMQISGAYYSIPKLLMLNLMPDQYEAVVSDKFKYQLDRVIATEVDESGETTTEIKQLTGNTPQPFVEELRALACQFSGATGVPLNSLGIVQDNPSSAEAIGAAREDICLIAKRDIKEDRPVLRKVALAALSVQLNTTVARLLDEHPELMDLYARFESPALHSYGEIANFVTQVSSVRDGFGKTDYAARLLGVPDEELDGVKSDETRAATAAMAQAIFGGVNG